MEELLANKGRVLFVDDEEHVRFLYSEELTDEGYEVFTADSGFRLLEKIEELKPDVVILDLKMENCNGLDLTMDIKEKYSNLPIILNSSYFPFKEDDNYKYADCCVAKSFDLTEIKVKIEHCLQKTKDLNIYDDGGTNIIIRDKAVVITEKYENEQKKQINILSYKENVDIHIENLKMNIALAEELIKGIINGITKDEKINELRKCIDTIHICSISVRLYEGIFSDIHLKLDNFEIDKLLKNLLSYNDKKIKHSIIKQENKKFNILSDRRLMEESLFVILQNINDYMFQNSGTISINLTTLDDHDKAESKIIIDFHFEINKPDGNLVEENIPKILVVDDDPTYQEILREELNDEFKGGGLSVLIANNGFECFDYLADYMFDLIILDLNMEGMKGGEVLETIRRNRKNRHIPVILNSADERVYDKKFQLNLNKYKPVDYCFKSHDFKPLVKSARSMMNTHHKIFSFKDLYDQGLNASIREDHVLNIGFWIVRKNLSALSCDIKFDDFEEKDKNGKSISLIIPKEFPLEGSINYSGSIFLENEMLYSDTLNKMNENIRHDLKNKLSAANFSMKKLVSQIGDQTLEAKLRLAMEKVSSCVKIADKIKNI